MQVGISSAPTHLHDSVGARAGILGMPNGAFLYADELLGALANKSAANGFKDMVLYIEACESGSIFEARLCSCLIMHLRDFLLRIGALFLSLGGYPAEAACLHSTFCAAPASMGAPSDRPIPLLWCQYVSPLWVMSNMVAFPMQGI